MHTNKNNKKKFWLNISIRDCNIKVCKNFVKDLYKLF